MGTVAWILAGVLIGSITPFLVVQFQRRRDLVRAGSAPVIPQREVMRPANPFAAVSIRAADTDPCKAVLAMTEMRYLAVRAPQLPVVGCDRKRCNCRFVRHADRRVTGSERRDAFARFGGLLPQTRRERRTREDRRRD